MVPMAGLQLDGRFTNESFVRFLGELSPTGSNDGVPQFTVCVRARLNYLRGQSNYIVSYAFNGTDNGLTICECIVNCDFEILASYTHHIRVYSLLIFLFLVLSLNCLL